LAEQAMTRAITEAQDQGVNAEGALHGEGVLDGLLAEARLSDLLVMGMPTRREALADPVAATIWNEERPLFERAECMLLVVCDPPHRVEKVLVNYQGGLAGKHALRAACAVAERLGHRLAIMSVDSDPLEAKLRVAAAEQYAAGFNVSAVETAGQLGGKPHEAEILDAVEQLSANFVVLGAEPRDLLSRLFQPSETEEIVLATRLPVLIAR
jgi:nucleotide-binding universal stress UspA family protein